MKILVTGASGKLGSVICRLSEDDVYGAYISNPPLNSSPVKIDIQSSHDVRKAVDEIRPDWVVHCAAMVGNVPCNSDPLMAWSVNVQGTMNVAAACKSVGCGIVYVSTSYVFDGLRGLYKESDQTNPFSVYGKTKLAGEWAAEIVEKNITVRLSLLYGDESVRKIADSISTSSHTDVVRNNFLCPTFDEDAARAVLRIMHSGSVGKFHIAADRVSRMDFFSAIARNFDLDEDRLKLVESLPGLPIGPADLSLDNSKAREMGLKFSDINSRIKSIAESRRQ